MEELVWNESLSLENDQLDRQNRKLLDILNQLIRHPEEKVDSEFISDSLRQLQDYIAEHLGYEEELLEKSDYPNFERHKNKHNEFRLKLAKLCLEVVNENTTAPTELIQFLHKWMLTHIAKDDHEYIPYLRET